MKQQVLPATDSKLRNKNLRVNQIEKKLSKMWKKSFLEKKNMSFIL